MDSGLSYPGDDAGTMEGEEVNDDKGRFIKGLHLCSAGRALQVMAQGMTPFITEPPLDCVVVAALAAGDVFMALGRIFMGDQDPGQPDRLRRAVARLEVAIQALEEAQEDLAQLALTPDHHPPGDKPTPR